MVDQASLKACERSCKAIGLFFQFMGVIFFVPVLLMLMLWPRLTEFDLDVERRTLFVVLTVVGGFFTVFSATIFLIGWGLRRLRPWSRFPAIGISALALLGVPIGTILGACFLIVLASEDAQVLFARSHAPET